MKPRKKQIRTLSLALIVTLCFDLVPFQAFAADKGVEPVTEPTGICEHHPFHTAGCGYVEAVPETACSHVHTEDCWREETHCVYEDMAQADLNEESTEDISSVAAHVCSEATGCVTKILDCRHQHDEECGYAPAVPGHLCEFVCTICAQGEDANGEVTQTAPYYLLLTHTLELSGGHPIRFFGGDRADAGGPAGRQLRFAAARSGKGRNGSYGN